MTFDPSSGNRADDCVGMLDLVQLEHCGLQPSPAGKGSPVWVNWCVTPGSGLLWSSLKPAVVFAGPLLLQKETCCQVWSSWEVVGVYGLKAPPLSPTATPVTGGLVLERKQLVSEGCQDLLLRRPSPGGSFDLKLKLLQHRRCDDRKDNSESKWLSGITGGTKRSEHPRE